MASVDKVVEKMKQQPNGIRVAEIDKQRVYRYIRKSRIREAQHDDGLMYYDEAAEAAIMQHFLR